MPVAIIAGGAAALLVSLALAWKWQLGLWRVTVTTVVLATIAGGAVTRLAGELPAGPAGMAVVVAATTLIAEAGLLLWRFYRDPERAAPAGDGLIVSPADGEICYVRRTRAGMLPVASKHGRDYPLIELTRTPLGEDDALVIGIAMSFLDVHVNRAPVAGTVTLRRHFPGQFGSLGRPGMVFANERATTVIDAGGLQIAVVQIASRLVRQIAGFVREGDTVAAGQRIGVIRLGSQVDLVVPLRSHLDVRVTPGQRVRAGQTVVASLGAVPAGEQPVAGAAS